MRGVHESARKLARRIEAGTARILSATVRRDGGRRHVAFCVQVDRADQTPARSGPAVGVDVGIRHLAVLSTGELVPNPRHLEHACSACGTVKTKLALAERTYECGTCGLSLDRDLDAARNLAALAAAETAGSGPVAGRGADHKTRPPGRRLRNVNPAPHPRARPGPSRRKAGLPTMCSPEHGER